MLEKYLQRQQHKNIQRVQAIADNITALVFIKDRNGNFLPVNIEYESHFRISNSAIIGRTEQNVFEKCVGLDVIA